MYFSRMCALTPPIYTSTAVSFTNSGPLCSPCCGETLNTPPTSQRAIAGCSSPRTPSPRCCGRVACAACTPTKALVPLNDVSLPVTCLAVLPRVANRPREDVVPTLPGADVGEAGCCTGHYCCRLDMMIVVVVAAQL